jgi:hypothetical protein
MTDGSFRLIAPDSLAAQVGVKTELLHPTQARSESTAATRASVPSSSE